MPLIVFPTPGQFEKSPCKEFEGVSPCKHAEVTRTFEDKVFVNCQMDHICNDLEDYGDLENGKFDLQV